jgi:hypothetical protein
MVIWLILGGRNCCSDAQIHLIKLRCLKIMTIHRYGFYLNVPKPKWCGFEAMCVNENIIGISNKKWSTNKGDCALLFGSFT